MSRLLIISSISLLALGAAAPGQAVVLFDFNNAPVYTPFPVDVTAGGMTAHLSATGQGYSIQSTSTVPIVPAGFTGHFIYPSSVFAADLLIGFSQTVTAFSIDYSPEELGCDDSARMRVTAYMNNVLVGTATHMATNPGTWPTSTLACTFTAGFNRVVVHYDAPPPTCQDYGPIFLADNMSVTIAPASVTSVGMGCGGTGVPVLAANAPHLGQNVAFTLVNGTPNAAGFIYFSGGPPLVSVVGSGCTVYVNLGNYAEFVPVLTNGTGAWGTSIGVPQDPALMDLQLTLQVALFNTAGPLGLDLSNGLFARVGS